MSSAEEQRPTRQTTSHGFAGLVRSWRYLFLLVVSLALFGFFYGEENWRGERNWEEYKLKLAQKGDTLDPAAFAPPTVPDIDNFAMTPVLAPLFQFVPGTQKHRDTNAFAQLQNFAPRFDAASRLVRTPKANRTNSWLPPVADLAQWCGAFLVPSNRAQWNGVLETNFTQAHVAEVVLRGLSECDPVFDELRAASKRKFSRFDLSYNQANPLGILLPHLGVLQRMCQALRLRASAELALGQTEAAFADLQLMAALIEATRTEPLLVSQLVRFAELRLMLRPIADGMGQWSEPELRGLQQILARFDFLSDIRLALKGERSLLGSQLIEYVRQQPSRLMSLESSDRAPGGMEQIGWNLVPTGWFYQEQANYCSMFDELILPGVDPENHRIRPDLLNQAARRMDGLIPQAGPGLFLKHRFFAALLLPAISQVTQKAGFAQTAADAGALACAIERYRRAHQQWPERLDQLLPDFASRVPADVVTGQPLHYRREGERYVLYSVGWNEKDEGGTCAAGEGKELTEGDWVWRPQ